MEERKPSLEEYKKELNELLEKLKWTSDEKEIREIRHRINKLVMIVDYYETKESA